jgi:uncharacterized damage-inducible protein DinB
MHTRSLTLTLALVALPGLAAAQGSSPDPKPDPAVEAIRPLYEQNRNWIIAVAEQVAEADYGFKPTPEVRSLGQMIGHVANAQYLFCSTALGEPNPQKQDIEEITGKAALVGALKAAFAYCDKAYQLPGDKAMEPAEIFGMKGTRLWILNFNAVHNGEHYGSFVTYMRLKGMVPPSSQPRK